MSSREDLDRALRERYNISLPSPERLHQRRVGALETFLLLKQLQRNIREWSAETKLEDSDTDDDKH